MFTPRPSLLPATVATIVAATQVEIGHELAAVCIAVANIVAATVLAVLGQRLRRSSRSISATHAARRDSRRLTKPRQPLARKPRPARRKPPA